MKVSNFKLQVTSYKLRVMSYYSFLTLLLSCFLTVSYGQAPTKEKPYSWEKGKGEVTIESIPMVTMPHLDIDALQKEDLLNDNNGTPFRFGYSEKVNLTMSNSGSWQTTLDGGQLWTLRIYSPDALSLNLLYDHFWLPEGARFHIYSEDQTQHIGAFTSNHNRGKKEDKTGFATGFLFTNSIVLEYYEPAGISDEGVISICKVVSGYRYAFDFFGKQGRDISDPPGCFQNIICDPDFNIIKDAVALMTMEDHSCSGALLNNTANDNSPLFLSANHCFVDDVDMADWIFYWNFEQLDCYDFVFGPYNKSTTGASLLAKRQETDFMLLKLIDDPGFHEDIDLYYLGWDRADKYGDIGYCIHHPLRAQKMIAYALQAIIIEPDTIKWRDKKGNIVEISQPNTHWNAGFTSYTTYKGSSGAPLLNRYKHVMGQLHGGTMGCPPEFTSTQFFGRFDLSWNGNSSSERLKDWLDPINSDLPYIDGIGYQCSHEFSLEGVVTGTNNYYGANYITSTQEIESGTTSYKAVASITLLPGFHAKLESEFTAQISPCKNNPIPYSIPEIQNSGIPENSLSQTQIEAQAQVNLIPNPNPGIFQLETSFPLSDIAHLKITNMLGIPVYETQNPATNTIQLQNATNGLYFVVVVLKDGSVLTQKMMVGR